VVRDTKPHPILTYAGVFTPSAFSLLSSFLFNILERYNCVSVVDGANYSQRDGVKDSGGS
jgi:hypothetical protein